MSRLIYLQKVALMLLGLEMTQVVGEEPGIMRPGVASDAWQACSRHISPCNRLFSTSFLILSESPAFSRLNISISLRLWLRNCGLGFRPPRFRWRKFQLSFSSPQKFEGDQENNMLIPPKLWCYVARFISAAALIWWDWNLSSQSIQMEISDNIQLPENPPNNKRLNPGVLMKNVHRDTEQKLLSMDGKFLRFI